MGKAPFKRTGMAALGLVAALTATALTTPASAGTPATATTAGTASATATSVKVNPTTASLSLGISLGVSLAGYTNNVAQAESRGIDLGIIGSIMAGEGCDGGDPTLPADRQPQPLRADSRTSSPEPKSETEKYAPFISKRVQAAASPFSQAGAEVTGLSGAGALFDLGATVSSATTQLANGNRQAAAIVDVASVKIAGIIEMAGLHWEARASSGTVDATNGAFSIGSLKVAGQQLPTGDPTAAFAAANTILNTLGIQITQPRAHVEAGILFVDPLIVRIVPNAQRDQIAALLLSTVQPMRESLVEALLAQDCGNATYVTVADVVLGALTGAGSFGLELGGVAAKAEPLKLTNFLGGTPLASAGGDDLGGFDIFDNNNTLDPLPDTPKATAVLDSGRGRRGPQLAATGEGSRGGKLALVGLFGLAALLLFAERDRRLMRQAQRRSLEA